MLWKLKLGGGVGVGKTNPKPYHCPFEENSVRRKHGKDYFSELFTFASVSSSSSTSLPVEVWVHVKALHCQASCCLLVQSDGEHAPPLMVSDLLKLVVDWGQWLGGGCLSEQPKPAPLVCGDNGVALVGPTSLVQYLGCALLWDRNSCPVGRHCPHFGSYCHFALTCDSSVTGSTFYTVALNQYLREDTFLRWTQGHRR